MAKLLRFQTPRAFYEHNLARFEAHYYIYLHVLNYLGILKEKKAVVHNAFNIVGEAGQEIIGFHVTGNYFLYGFSWTPAMLELLGREIDFSQCKPTFHFLGQRDLINHVMASNPGRWHVYKERIIYECRLPGSLRQATASVENATLADIDALAALTLAYSREEYPDRLDKNLELAYGQAHYGIRTKNMFVVKQKRRICGILQVIQKEDYNRPLIGSLYILPAERNKGYAALLVGTVTAGLLKNGYETCGLLSDATNPASNKVFLRVGYLPIYDWLDVVMD